MARSRASAKKAGSEFERLVADYLAEEVDDRIDRAVKTGALDKGDIGGVRIGKHRVAIEVKNEAKPRLSGWAAEAEAERINLGAVAGVVIHKRHGKANPADQWVTITLRDFAALLRAANGEDERP